jgi:hypothetical protein
MQQLWNAGADDEVGGGHNGMSDSMSSWGSDGNDQKFSPRQWLSSQRDDAEMKMTGD